MVDNSPLTPGQGRVIRGRTQGKQHPKNATIMKMEFLASKVMENYL